MKNQGVGHLKTWLFTKKPLNNVGCGGPWYDMFGLKRWSGCGVFFRRVLPSAISNARGVGAGFVTWMIFVKLAVFFCSPRGVFPQNFTKRQGHLY